MRGVYIGEIQSIINDTNRTITFVVPNRVEGGIAIAINPFLEVSVGEGCVLYLIESPLNSLWYYLPIIAENKFTLTDKTKKSDDSSATKVALDFEERTARISSLFLSVTDTHDDPPKEFYQPRFSEYWEHLVDEFGKINDELNALARIYGGANNISTNYTNNITTTNPPQIVPSQLVGDNYVNNFILDDCKSEDFELRDDVKEESEEKIGDKLVTLVRDTLYPSQTLAFVENLLSPYMPYIKKYFPDFGITNKMQICHFLAQCSVETMCFKHFTEQGSSSYLKSKPYYPYIGRGFIQLTHKKNYEIFQLWLKEKYGLVYDLVNQPNLVADLPELSVLSGLRYWTEGNHYSSPSAIQKWNGILGINNTKGIYCYDLAEEDYATRVSRLVNGGDNGLDKRLSYTNKYKSNYDKIYV